ncbi:hypothetical protein DRP05_11400 [Archaeoglobales archaeon]|nr:MAG: hypothetical protein DRP05_11400 [Archaeoglobales archaeon]
MRLEEIFSDSFDLAKKLTEDFGKLLILMVLSIIPLLDLIVIGYGYRIVQMGRRELPELDNYLDLFINGLKIIVVVIYFITPILLILISLGLKFTSVVILIMFLSISLLFLLAIVAAIGIVHMIVNNSMAKAFAIGEIMDIISKIGWSKYLLWLLVVFIISIVISAFESIPYIGLLISGVLAPFYTVFAARASYLIYMEAKV